MEYREFLNKVKPDLEAMMPGNEVTARNIQKLQDDLKTVWERANDLELKYEILVSPTVIPVDEFERYKSDLPYYRNIDKGILVDG